MRGGALRCAAMWSAHSGSGEGRKWVHVIVLCSLLALGFCSGTTQPSSPPPMPALSVTPASLAMADCTSAQLSVDARDASGQVSAEPVTFSSTDVGVAAVDSNGLVVATGSGTATVVVSKRRCAGAVRDRFRGCQSCAPTDSRSNIPRTQSGPNSADCS